MSSTKEIKELANVYALTYPLLSDDEIHAQVIQRLTKFSPTTIELLHSHLTNGDHEVVSEMAKAVVWKYSEEDILNYLCLRSKLSDYCHDDEDTALTYKLVGVASLKDYPAFSHIQDVSKISAHESEQVLAILWVAMAMYEVDDKNEEDESLIVIQDERIVQLVLDDPNKSRKIAEVVRERSIVNFEVIESTFGTYPAVSEGIL